VYGNALPALPMFWLIFDDAVVVLVHSVAFVVPSGETAAFSVTVGDPANPQLDAKLLCKNKFVLVCSTNSPLQANVDGL
jgi:hypothetical protein